MAAKAIAAAWGLPLVRLDMSLILSGTFGTPQYAFARATRLAEEIALMVLWVDELENAFGYDPNAPGSKGNVNIFSSFKTWLQEKSPKVFVATTKGWSGAEIEQVVKSARIDAYQADRPFNERDLIRNAIATVLLSKTMVEQVR